MRHSPVFDLDDADEIRALVEANPWVTMVSTTDEGLVASHYPVIVDRTRDDLSLLSHVGRPDEELHRLGSSELLLIVQGPHGYISPGWYDANPAVPTWNFTAAHLYGVPELLSAEENLRVLAELVDRFEERMPEPRRMNADPANAEYAARISAGTVGFRLTPTRAVGKRKLSQNKPAATVDRVIAELEGTGPYASPALAADMRRARGDQPS
jgi:transcriptional regulator